MLLNSLYRQNECHRLQLTSLVSLERTSKMDSYSLQQTSNRISLLKYQYRGSFPSDYVPTLDNDTFVIIHTQPSNMQGEHWIKNANSCQKLFFADSLGREKYSFLKQQHEQMMQNHYSPITAFAVSTRYMQLFISSNSDKKKLQDFTMLMYFPS